MFWNQKQMYLLHLQILKTGDVFVSYVQSYLSRKSDYPRAIGQKTYLKCKHLSLMMKNMYYTLTFHLFTASYFMKKIDVAQDYF